MCALGSVNSTPKPLDLPQGSSASSGVTKKEIKNEGNPEAVGVNAANMDMQEPPDPKTAADLKNIRENFLEKEKLLKEISENKKKFTEISSDTKKKAQNAAKAMEYYRDTYSKAVDSYQQLFSKAQDLYRSKLQIPQCFQDAKTLLDEIKKKPVDKLTQAELDQFSVSLGRLVEDIKTIDVPSDMTPAEQQALREALQAIPKNASATGEILTTLANQIRNENSPELKKIWALIENGKSSKLTTAQETWKASDPKRNAAAKALREKFAPYKEMEKTATRARLENYKKQLSDFRDKLVQSFKDPQYCLENVEKFFEDAINWFAEKFGAKKIDKWGGYQESCTANALNYLNPIINSIDAKIKNFTDAPGEASKLERELDDIKTGLINEMSKGRMSVLVNNMQRHFHPTEPLLLPDLPAREDTGCAKFLDELKTKAKAGETGLGSEVEYRILNMKPDERLGDILDAADAAESKGIEEFVDKLRSNQSLNDESRVILSSIGPCKTPADTEKAMEKLRLIAKSEAKDVYNEAKNHMASTTFPESLKADIESIKTKIAENERSLNADNIEDALMVISSYNFNTDNLLAKFDKIKNKTNINAIENAEKSLKANRPKADAAKQIDDIIKNLTPGNVNESFASLQKILDPATYSALKASLELKGLKVDTAIPLMKKLIAVIQTITAETPQVKVMRYKLLGSAMAATGFRLSWVDGRAKGWQVPNVHREDIAGFFGQVKDGMNSAFGNDDRYNELVKMLDYENGGWGGFEHIGKFRYDHGETLAKIPEPTRELFNAFMDGILNPIKLGVGMNESVAKKWNVYYPNGGLNAAQTANDRDRKEAGILASLPIYGIDARSIEETAQAMKEWMKLHDGFGSVSATKEVLDSCTRITDAYKTVSEIISELKTKDLSDTSKKNKQIIDTTFSELDNKENFDGIRRIENDAGRCIQLAASKPENSFSGEALDKLKTVLGNLKTKFDTENSEAKKILDDLKNNPYLTNPSKEILSKFDRIVTDNELTNFKKALGEIKIIEQKANEKDDADILKAFGGDVKLMEKLTDCGKANKEKASEDQKQAIENQEKAKEVARQNTEKVHKVYQQANDLACRRYVSDEEVTNLKREIANLKDMPGIDEGTKSVLDGIVRLKGTTQATDSYQDDFREFRRGGGRRQLNPKDPDEMGDWMLRETVNRLVRVREGMQKRFDDLKLPLLSTPAPYLTASDITKIQQWVSQANIEHLKKIADIFDKSSTSSKTIRASEAKEISAKMGEYLKEADGVQKRLKDLEGVMPLARDFDKITSLDELRGISFSKLGAVDKAKFIQKYLALASNDPSSKNYVKFLQGVPRTKSKDGAWIAEGFYIEFLFNSKSLINAVDDTLALAAGSQRDRLAEHTDKLKADQLYLKASTAAVAAMKNLADGKIELVNMPNVTRNFIEYMGQSAKYPVDDNDGKYIPVLPKDYETNPSNDRFILMDENTMALPPDKLEEAFKAVDNKATLDQLEPGKAFGVKKVTVTVGKQSYIVKVGYTTNKEQFKMCVRELEGGDPVKNIGTLPAYPCAKTDLVKTCENVSTNIGTSLQTHQTELKYVMDQLNLIENLASTIRKRLEEMLKLIFSNWR